MTLILKSLQCSFILNLCLVVAVLCDVTKASHTLKVAFFVTDKETINFPSHSS